MTIDITDRKGEINTKREKSILNFNENTPVSRWIRCPSCGKKTRTKVYEDTVLIRFPLYCPKCGTETIIDVMKFEYKISAEPDV